ncbi:gp43 [Burkholderia pseudomallei]|nr:gp43 [Burkholderia pseudomallei]CAJ4793018.1 gp43 [Burkholderia pseudomallei]
MNDQQQSRADALTEIAQFLTDVVTAAGLLSYGHADKKLATRITDQAYELRKRMYFLTASPVEQPAAAPASANETGAEGASERFIVIGHGESDIPEAKIVARRADVLDAVLSMIYGGPCPDDAMRAEYASMLGDWDGDHWNVTFEIGGIDVWRASLSRSPAMAAAAPADEHSTIECQAHSGPDCIECNGTGAWSGSADERAVSFEAWCDRFPEISAVERLRDAWQEARAAASPAAEAVTITDAEAEMLVGIKKFHTHDFGRGPELHANAITDAYKRGRAAAPQPAQASPAAERVTAALQALSADVHTLGDGWANDEAMIGLAKKYLRVEPKPASPELSLWRDFVLLAVTDTAPQPAQADAQAETREPLNEVLFGNDEALEMAADALDRLGQDSAAAGVRAVAYELRMLAHKMRCAPADAGEAVAHMRVRSTDAGSTSHAIDIAPEAAALDLKPGEYLLYLAPPTTRAAYLTTTLSPDQRISTAAKLFCFANELLNGADQS